MYNKIKKYINTDRIINEDNDYLLKEEYDSILEIKNNCSDIHELLDAYNKYAKPKFEELTKNENLVFELSSIKIIKPSEYDAVNRNGITFVAYISNKNSLFKRDISHHEQGFNLKFIKKYYDLLCKLSLEEAIDKIDSRYDDYASFLFKGRFMDKIKLVETSMSDIDELIEYYKDKVVVVKQDQRIIDELKELDDFFENL